MTAPVLAHKKFYIIKPAEGTNQIKNPIFSPPEYVTGWAANGAGVTIEACADGARFGAYCMKVNTATGVPSRAHSDNFLSVISGLDYTFSVYVLGMTGQAMSVYIADTWGTPKATKTFTATGYWQRVEVTHTAAEDASTYRVYVNRDAVASTAPFYVDGAQFEQASAATTLIEGYMPGCRWESYARNSASIRSAQYRKGGEIVDLSDYCEIVQVTGLGHGDWNQILTKMTSGGDMYQTHTRKSRNFSIIVDFTGNSLSEIETNRKAVIDLIRPDLLTGQEMIVRYQGVDVNGYEATNPVDIVCVPLSASMVDTPDLPTYQRAVLNFTIPSGLLQGAYNEGKELDLYADFPAEYIVKRDADGNWCEYVTDHYENLLQGQGTDNGLNNTVYCMAEGPDGKIYVCGDFTNAGTVAEADYLARWNPVSEAWESVISGINNDAPICMAFDANGDLYIGGYFTDLGSASGDYIVKITDLSGTPTVNALGTGTNGAVWAIAIGPNGEVYAGGAFTLAGGVANTTKIAKWDGTSWSALSTGLNNTVHTLAFAPNGVLYVGGEFTDASYPRICKWNGTSFSAVGTAGDISSAHVSSLAFDFAGNLYVGGGFTNAGGVANADYIAKWNGSSWSALGTGTDDTVHRITIDTNEDSPKFNSVYVTGDFTTAGGLTLADRIAIYSNGAWSSLDIDLPGTGISYAILTALDGSLYIGGEFNTSVDPLGENAETGIVALNLNVSSASANTYPFMQVAGPGTLKAITNYSTGKSIMFDGLTLNAGEWINLHFDPLNLRFYGGWSGRGNLMRYIVPGSDYGDFYLKPGNNLISLFFPDSDENLGSGAFISWTPLFWGIDGALL